MKYWQVQFFLSEASLGAFRLLLLLLGLHNWEWSPLMCITPGTERCACCFQVAFMKHTLCSTTIATTFSQMCWLPWQCTNDAVIHLSGWQVFYLPGWSESVFWHMFKISLKYTGSGVNSTVLRQEHHGTSSASEGRTWLVSSIQPGRLDSLGLRGPKL